MRTKYILLLIVGWLSCMTAEAQNDKLTVYGSGRFILQNNSRSGELFQESILNGDTLAADTVSTRREIGGVALFDLGFRIKPNSSTEINALTRVSGDLDGFWGAGIGFTFRELYVRGLVKNKVRYRVGDLDLKMTPFTLYNSNPDLGTHSMSALSLFQDINEYENFSRDNQWRQQGAHIDFQLLMGEKGDRVDFMGYMTKNRQTDFFFVPDRLMTGGQVVWNREGLGRVFAQTNNFFEIAETAQFNEGTSATSAHSLGAELAPFDNKSFVLYGEGGMSYQGYVEQEGAPEEKEISGFVDLGLRKPAKDGKFGYYGEIMHVSSGFRSPGAQSRRVNFNSFAQNLTFETNQETTRALTAFDLIQDATVYNNTIVVNLQDFHPGYSNVLPYGKATPNRQGLLAGIVRMADSLVVSKVGADVALLTEASGQGIATYRNFAMVDIDAELSLHNLWGGKMKTKVEAHFHLENTSRDGLDAESAAVAGIGELDLSSNYFEAGISHEIAEGLALHVAAVGLSANGNEFIALRDGFGQVVDYTDAEYDFSDMTYLVGMRYGFSPTSNLQVQFRTSEITNELDPTSGYNWNQFIFTYNLFF
ncbi:MAG: hypothetical protein P8H59_06550 [Flavobacteriales bacterium]|nr:hypothetical protein [Flavobacteriales bacterium]MDG1780590.1 hypothetical protein [Flavobacteriales bacterium]MDG2246381.1 hypothetical protein [Flavobacteriales bacterium]